MAMKAVTSFAGRRVGVLCVLPVIAFATAGCLPKFLEKYRTAEPVSAASESDATAESPASSATAAEEHAPVGSSRPLPVSESDGIRVLDRNTFLVRSDAKDVWEATLTILLKNYNLNIVNKEAGIITTEWDSFYLKDKVLRNKLSLRVKPLLRGECEVTIYNNVEELREPLRKDDGTAGVWLPSDQGLREVGRVVQNLAISLNLGNPRLPADMMMARSQTDAPQAN